MVRNGKPYTYPDEKWERARDKLWAHLEQWHPDEKLRGAVVLNTTWCFPLDGHEDGEPYLKKPDTDNLQKGLKDIMTKLGWWADDALVFQELTTKIYSEVPGIRIDIEELR